MVSNGKLWLGGISQKRNMNYKGRVWKEWSG